jgi:hypothetical protein
MKTALLIIILLILFGFYLSSFILGFNEALFKTRVFEFDICKYTDEDCENPYEINIKIEHLWFAWILTMMILAIYTTLRSR